MKLKVNARSAPLVAVAAASTLFFPACLTGLWFERSVLLNQVRPAVQGIVCAGAAYTTVRNEPQADAMQSVLAGSPLCDAMREKIDPYSAAAAAQGVVVAVAWAADGRANKRRPV